ncbi:hypothetical protein Ancab_004398 [Ancistrocladus abbreviatus]
MCLKGGPEIPSGSGRGQKRKVRRGPVIHKSFASKYTFLQLKRVAKHSDFKRKYSKCRSVNQIVHGGEPERTWVATGPSGQERFSDSSLLASHIRNMSTMNGKEERGANEIWSLYPN